MSLPHQALMLHPGSPYPGRRFGGPGSSPMYSSPYPFADPTMPHSWATGPTMGLRMDVPPGLSMGHPAGMSIDPYQLMSMMAMGMGMGGGMGLPFHPRRRDPYGLGYGSGYGLGGHHRYGRDPYDLFGHVFDDDDLYEDYDDVEDPLLWYLRAAGGGRRGGRRGWRGRYGGFN